MSVSPPQKARMLLSPPPPSQYPWVRSNKNERIFFLKKNDAAKMSVVPRLKNPALRACALQQLTGLLHGSLFVLTRYGNEGQSHKQSKLGSKDARLPGHGLQRRNPTGCPVPTTETYPKLTRVAMQQPGELRVCHFQQQVYSRHTRTFKMRSKQTGSEDRKGQLDATDIMSPLLS